MFGSRRGSASALRAVAAAATAAALACAGGDRPATSPPEQPSRPAAPVGPSTRKAADESDLCARNDECVLMPQLDCCGDCPPAPPFEALTQRELQRRLRLHDDACATEDHDCAAHRCEPVAESCVARAECGDGRCQVVSVGCP